MKTLIQDAVIVNEGRSFVGSVLIDGAFVAAVYEEGETPRVDGATVINARGQWLLPGVIDDHVHFREPGMTRKGTIASESRAAVAGGVTTFMDMPNTNPKTVTRREWEWKMERAAETSAANYAFYFGGSDNNADEIRRLDSAHVPGLKLFLGSSTGNGAMNADTVRLLENMGHKVARKAAMGSTQSIMVTPNGLYGASDPRIEDAATLGY